MAAHLVKNHGLDVKVPHTTTPAHAPTGLKRKKSEKSKGESSITILGELDVNSA